MYHKRNENKFSKDKDEKIITCMCAVQVGGSADRPICISVPTLTLTMN